MRLEGEALRERRKQYNQVPSVKTAKRVYAAKKREAYRAWLDFVKSEPCMDCGGTFSPVAMQFDHARGSKLFELGTAGSRHKTAIFNEMQKCDLVCANCHAVRTHARLVEA